VLVWVQQRQISLVIAERNLTGHHKNKKMRKERKNLAQTPSPPSERIYGSKRNVKGSASNESVASMISFSSSLLTAIRSKIVKYNEKNPKRKISLATAKAIVRRGLGAYSKSHRPLISGGAPNSRTAWGLARLSAFMRKKSGSTTANGGVKSAPIKATYIQDDDLI